MANNVQINVTPEPALIDDLLQIRVSGLSPGQAATLRAEQRDALDRLWRSEATFEADDEGVIDVSSLSALSGTYEDVDPRGLFWSMRLADETEQPTPFARTGIDPLLTTLKVEVDSTVVAQTGFERRFISPEVTALDVNDRGLVGRFSGLPSQGCVQRCWSSPALAAAWAARRMWQPCWPRAALRRWPWPTSTMKAARPT